MALIAEVTGKQNYKFDIDRPCEKLAFRITTKGETANPMETMDKVGLGKAIQVSVKIASKNGSNINIANNIPMRNLADYGQWNEGFMGLKQIKTATAIVNQSYIYFPIGNGGDILLTADESISIELNDCPIDVKIELFTIESEALTSKYYKYNQFATNHGVKNLNITNASSLIIEKQNFQEIDINFANNNNTNYRTPEMEFYANDTNDICIVHEFLASGANILKPQRAQYGSFKNYIMDIFTATNMQIHATKEKVCEFILVEIGNKGAVVVEEEK